jgi:hypothetical protein
MKQVVLGFLSLALKFTVNYQLADFQKWQPVAFCAKSLDATYDVKIQTTELIKFLAKVSF